jgi:hypothetical protein
MSAFDEILIAFGGNATLLIVLGFLARSLMNNWLAKDIKKFETDLQNTATSQLERLRYDLKSQGDVSIEQLKSRLQQATIEHQVRFSKLHEKRALVIADLYERFVTAYWAAYTYHQWCVFEGGPTEQEQAASAMQGLSEAHIFFEKNRIYLSDTLPGELDTFFERAKSLTFKAQYSDSERESRKEGLEAFKKEFPEMRRRLDVEFKKLLGPSESTDTTT